MTVGTSGLTGSAGISISLKATLPGDLSERVQSLLVNVTGWNYGTSANAANVIYADTTTLTDGSNTTLDLYASGTLLDIFGQALTIEALKFLYIKNNSPDSTLLVGGGASNDLDIWADTSDIHKIPAGGDAILWNDPSAAGLDITTNKNLKLEDDGTGAVGDKLIDVIALGLD